MRNIPPWAATCDSDGCTGVRLPTGDKCWTHADQSHLDTALEGLGAGARLDARGVRITNKLLRLLVDAAPLDGGRKVLAHADFSWAVFEDTAEFLHMVFRGETDFSRTTFEHEACFNLTAFQGDVHFEDTCFKGIARFFKTSFHGARAVFSEAKFQDEVDFFGSVFCGLADFNGAVFGRVAQFSESVFQGDAWFVGAGFQRSVFFTEARFQGNARLIDVRVKEFAGFNGVAVEGVAEFNGGIFEQAQSVGPMITTGLNLNDVIFARRVQITAAASYLSCRAAQFPDGVQFWLHGAGVVLDDSSFPAPSILASIPGRAEGSMAGWVKRVVDTWQRMITGKTPERARLFSLQRADVAGLGLSGIDLADCRFAGAHNLDKLRLEADVTLATAPARLGWDRRQVIADERAWRARRFRRWTAPKWPDWTGDDEPVVLEPGQIAGLYRALRKGREDSRDEPGAADFYYGEVEMRRHARSGSDARSLAGTASRGRAERGILTLYWLVSGYGLRAWRALACLAVVIAGFAVGFHLIGFTTPPQPTSYWTSLLYAFRATVSLTDDEVKLTAWGSLLQALLRLAGPVLLGLALLAVRNRVKR